MKTRYLKGITIVQLFIISIRDYSIGFILAGNFFKYSPNFYLANLISNRKIDIDINREIFIWVFYGYATFYLV